MFKKIIGTLFGALALVSVNANAVVVDLELQLLSDVSGSISAAEYQLQLDGYEAAFRNAGVINSILAGANGAIAVQFVEWSGSAQQAVVVNWFLINDSITANAFADAIAAAVRTFSGLTGISAAIDYGANLFAGNGYDGTRQVIDIAGDGTENEGGNVAASRNAALALGIDTINGITIGGSATVSSFYVNNVIGGTNAFQLDVNDFGDFAAGIEAKLIREIRQVSTPATILLFSGVLLGFVVRRRKSY